MRMIVHTLNTKPRCPLCAWRKYLSSWKGNQSNAMDSAKCDQEPSPLHCPMKGEEGQIFRRENGAAVAFSEYGDPRGAPVFFCHGWPSSRTMAELTDEAAWNLGVRIISPDRPGIRDSNFHPN